jgi:hypothetical protein
VTTRWGTPYPRLHSLCSTVHIQGRVVGWSRRRRENKEGNHLQQATHFCPGPAKMTSHFSFASNLWQVAKRWVQVARPRGSFLSVWERMALAGLARAGEEGLVPAEEVVGPVAQSVVVAWGGLVEVPESVLYLLVALVHTCCKKCGWASLDRRISNRLTFLR